MCQALDDIGCDEVEISFRAVESGFGGSPSLLVDDVDLFGSPASAGALTCLVYPTDIGLSGVPTVASLVARLRERTG